MQTNKKSEELSFKFNIKTGTISGLIIGPLDSSTHFYNKNP